MRLKSDLDSLAPGYVVDITGLSDSNEYKIVKAPSDEDARVLFHGGKLMSLNERDARYAGYALLDDGLVSEFLSAENAKLFSHSASHSSHHKSDASSRKMMMVKPGHALDIDSFDSTRKASMVKVPADLDSTRMVLFYDGKLIAAEDAEDDVLAYASHVAAGDDRIENGIIASYYDECAKKMLGSSKMASARSRSPYSMRSTQARSIQSSRMPSRHLQSSPAVSDVSAFMSDSCESSCSASPGLSRSRSPIASRYSYQTQYEDESFDDQLGLTRPASPVRSSGMQTRSMAKQSSSSRQLPSRMQTRQLTERQQPSRYQPYTSYSRYPPSYAQDLQKSALKPSSVRYSSKSPSPKLDEV
jgi:hypothetical protein